jgi:PAS domain-containing protein
MEINFGTAVIESMPEGFTLIDSDRRYLYMNHAALNQCRMSREQLIGYRITEVYPGFEHSDVFKAMAEVMHSRQAKDFVATIEVPGEDDRLLELSIRPSADGIVIISADLCKEDEKQIASLKEAATLELQVVLQQQGIEGHLLQNNQNRIHA